MLEQELEQSNYNLVIKVRFQAVEQLIQKTKLNGFTLTPNLNP